MSGQRGGLTPGAELGALSDAPHRVGHRLMAVDPRNVRGLRLGRSSEEGDVAELAARTTPKEAEQVVRDDVDAEVQSGASWPEP
jgi:hypothetical protein